MALATLVALLFCALALTWTVGSVVGIYRRQRREDEVEPARVAPPAVGRPDYAVIERLERSLFGRTYEHDRGQVRGPAELPEPDIGPVQVPQPYGFAPGAYTPPEPPRRTAPPRPPEPPRRTGKAELDARLARLRGEPEGGACGHRRVRTADGTCVECGETVRAPRAPSFPLMTQEQVLSQLEAAVSELKREQAVARDEVRELRRQREARERRPPVRCEHPGMRSYWVYCPRCHERVWSW